MSQFIDAARTIPFEIWCAIVFLGAVVWFATLVLHAEFTTTEQRDEIARCDRELRGSRGMPSTRSTSTRLGGTSQPNQVGRGSADGPGPVWRARPRRDLHP